MNIFFTTKFAVNVDREGFINDYDIALFKGIKEYKDFFSHLSDANLALSCCGWYKANKQYIVLEKGNFQSKKQELLEVANKTDTTLSKLNLDEFNSLPADTVANLLLRTHVRLETKSSTISRNVYMAGFDINSNKKFVVSVQFNQVEGNKELAELQLKYHQISKVTISEEERTKGRKKRTALYALDGQYLIDATKLDVDSNVTYSISAKRTEDKDDKGGNLFIEAVNFTWEDSVTRVDIMNGVRDRINAISNVKVEQLGLKGELINPSALTINASKQIALPLDTIDDKIADKLTEKQMWNLAQFAPFSSIINDLGEGERIYVYNGAPQISDESIINSLSDTFKKRHKDLEFIEFDRSISEKICVTKNLDEWINLCSNNENSIHIALTRPPYVYSKNNMVNSEDPLMRIKSELPYCQVINTAEIKIDENNQRTLYSPSLTHIKDKKNAKDDITLRFGVSLREAWLKRMLSQGTLSKHFVSQDALMTKRTLIHVGRFVENGSKLNSYIIHNGTTILGSGVCKINDSLSSTVSEDLGSQMCSKTNMIKGVKIDDNIITCITEKLEGAVSNLNWKKDYLCMNLVNGEYSMIENTGSQVCPPPDSSERKSLIASRRRDCEISIRTLLLPYPSCSANSRLRQFAQSGKITIAQLTNLNSELSSYLPSPLRDNLNDSSILAGLVCLNLLDEDVLIEETSVGINDKNRSDFMELVRYLDEIEGEEHLLNFNQLIELLGELDSLGCGLTKKDKETLLKKSIKRSLQAAFESINKSCDTLELSQKQIEELKKSLKSPTVDAAQAFIGKLGISVNLRYLPSIEVYRDILLPISFKGKKKITAIKLAAYEKYGVEVSENLLTISLPNMVKGYKHLSSDLSIMKKGVWFGENNQYYSVPLQLEPEGKVAKFSVIRRIHSTSLDMLRLTQSQVACANIRDKALSSNSMFKKLVNEVARAAIS
ncbi:hypothetical protein KW882_04680 [Vibrio parahaemolyticus]